MVCSLATMQAMGQTVSAEDFRSAVQSGTLFVDMMLKVRSVAECAVPPLPPPGAPSIIDMTLNGLNELGRLVQSCAAQWWVQASRCTRFAVAKYRWRLMLLLVTLLRLMLRVFAWQATGVHG